MRSKQEVYRFRMTFQLPGTTELKAAQYESPKLTTFYQNVGEMGRQAAVRLIEEIEHPMTTIPAIHTQMVI